MPQKFIKKKKNISSKWRRGDSCSTNPGKRKFREEIIQNSRSYYRQTTNSSSGLTASNIAKHNESIFDENDDDILLDGELKSEYTISQSKTSLASSISGLTDCSNMTFNKIQNLWASSVEEHKKICAVLAAVTEVIRANSGSETDTEYFAALVVAVQNAQDEETLSAIFFLLSLVMKRVHASILQQKFAEISKIFFDLLGQYYQSGKTSLLKNLISCLSMLLLNQDSHIWMHSSTTQIFQSILSLSVHLKPKVRKSAQSGVSSILKMNLVNNKSHPTGDMVSKFCIKCFTESEEESSSVLHALNLLKIVLHYLKPECIRKISEEILNLMQDGKMLLKITCLETFNSLFEACPPESNLPASLNGKIVLALYDIQPNINDIQLLPAWLKVMESAHVNLGIIHSKLCLEALPRLFSICMVYLLSESKTVAKFALSTMLAIIQKCLLSVTNLTADDLKEEQINNFHAIFSYVEQGLKFKYHQVWDLVLTLLASFFEHFGGIYSKCMTKCLITICDFHESANFPYLTELEKVVAAAIKAMGPKEFLKAYPMNLLRSGDNCEFPRSWLLPLMRENIEETELQYFISDFLPLASQLHEKGQVCLKNGRMLEAKVYDTLQHQIWALLPGFCKNPTDVKQSFKNIARILGKALTDKPEIRHVVLLSLRTIILKSSDSDSAEIAKYSKNYLPILLNLYTSNSEESDNKLSLSVLETIKLFLNLADKKLVSNLFENARMKIDDPFCSTNKWLAIVDLMAALISHVDQQKIEDCYNFILPLIETDNHKKQKKAYRILEEICLGKSEGCCAFVLDNLEELEKNLSISEATAGPSSKAPRLRCLTGIVRKLTANHKDFLKTILPEVILSTKATNAKARVAAFNLLEEIGNIFIYFDSCSKEDAVEKYVTLVMADISGPPNMMSGTLIAINRLIRVYKDCLPAVLIEKLVSTSIQLLRSKDRDVTRAALALVKAIITQLDRDELMCHTEALLKNLFAGRKTEKNFLRTQTQFILEKLMRKVGYEMLRTLVPDDFKKFVTNVHRILEKRRMSRKSANQVSEAKSKMKYQQKTDKYNEDPLDDSSSDGLEDQSSSFITEKQFMQESSGNLIFEQPDSVVDLLDSTMSKTISASRPSNIHDKKAPKVNEFSVAANGKLVIEEQDENNLLQAKSIDDKLSTAATEKIESHKRRRGSLDENDHDEPERKKDFIYQPGGGGIHRSLIKEQERPKVVLKQGAEYKAKKAGGDIKIKGKPDPFAYIPLNRQTLNRRKRAKIDGQFKGVVKAARRSATKNKGIKLLKRRK